MTSATVPGQTDNRAVLGAFAVAADHPCLPGHFPGNPLVPGVVLLDHALAIVQARRPGSAVTRLDAVKFSGVVRPDQTVTVRLDAASEPDAAIFVCEESGRVVLRGRVRFAQRDER